MSSRKPSLTAPSNRNYGFCLEEAGLHWATKKMRSPRDREPTHTDAHAYCLVHCELCTFCYGGSWHKCWYRIFYTCILLTLFRKLGPHFFFRLFSVKWSLCCMYAGKPFSYIRLMSTLKDFLWPTWAKKTIGKQVGYFYIVILDACPCIRVPTSPGWMFMVECWGLIEGKKEAAL